MKRLILILTVFAFTLTAHFVAEGQTNASFDETIKNALKKIPATGKTAGDFVPAGWEIDSEASGDLNGDGIDDHAMSVSTERIEDLLPHIEIVLLGDKTGGFRRLAANGKFNDGSGFDTRPALEIKKGVLLLRQNYGNGSATDVQFRFRYDPVTGRLMLIGFDTENYSRPGMYDGRRVSENYLTGVRIETTDHVDSRKNSKGVYRNSTSKQMKTLRLKISFEDAQLGWDDKRFEVRPN